MTTKEEAMDFSYELIVQKEMFYNEDSMWGVYSFKFANQEDQQNSVIPLHPVWNNFTVSGEVFQLSEGEKYHVSFEESYTDRYGDGFSFTGVKTEGLKKRSAQVEFLNTVLPVTIAQDIDKKHKDNNDLLNSILEDKINLLEINRVTEKNIETYKKAVAEYEDYQSAIVLLAPIGVNVRTIKSLSDKAGGTERLLQIINKDIYKLTAFDNFGFKKVDDYALKLGYSKDSASRILSGSVYVLEQMSSYGDIKIPIEDFDKEMSKILEVDEVTDDIFDKIISSSKIHYDGGYIALSKYRDEEQEIVDRIVKLQKEVEPLEGFEEAFNEAIQEQEELSGFKFTDEQIKAIRLVQDNGIMVINGVAGSGKSTISKTIVEIINKLGMYYTAAALSGKASQVLLQNGLHNSSTIHRMLKWIPKKGFHFNEEKPLMSDLIIIDEASMNNNTLFVAVLRAMKKGSRLILIGDSGQLPPIGHGAFFENLLKLESPRVELTKVHRQAAKSGVITTANKIRNHEQINHFGTDDNQVIGELEDMRVFNYIDKAKIYDDLIATVTRFNNNPTTNKKDIQVLTAMKRGELGVPKLNAGIQEILNPHPKNGILPHFKHKNTEFRVGDRVIQNGNFYEAKRLENLEDYKYFKSGEMTKTKTVDGEEHTFDIMVDTSVFNGSIGYIQDVFKDPAGELTGMLVEFDTYIGKELIYYFNTETEQNIGMLDLAYAITVHRSQGSGFNTVIFAFDYSAFMLLSKEFVYTGITRAINHCLMFVENSALHYAIKTTQSTNRKTFIKDFLGDKLK